MKKITIVFLLISFVLATTAQTPLTVRQLQGNVKSPGKVIDNPNRSVPPGILVYSQPFLCPPYNGILAMESTIELADDFILTSSTPVTTVRWWFFMTGDPATTPWVVRIYDNEDCLPSSLLQTWNIAAADVSHEYVCSNFGYLIYDLNADLSTAFNAVPNVQYWISISPVDFAANFWCNYGTPGAYNSCPALIRAPASGFPEFTDISNLVGFPGDFCYELYSSTEVPVETPVSNWAIAIGIFLILGLAALRFRRMI